MLVHPAVLSLQMRGTGEQQTRHCYCRVPSGTTLRCCNLLTERLKLRSSFNNIRPKELKRKKTHRRAVSKTSPLDLTYELLSQNVMGFH